MDEGAIDNYNQPCVVLRSPDLTAVTERTALPPSGIFPEPLKSPVPNWTVHQAHDYLKLHGPGTKVHTDNFVIIDARSLQDYTCEIADNKAQYAGTKSMRQVDHELKTVRATFRSSILELANYDIANIDIEEAQKEAGGGVLMADETEETRKRDLEGGTWEETVLRSGKVVRDQI